MLYSLVPRGARTAWSARRSPPAVGERTFRAHLGWCRASPARRIRGTESTRASTVRARLGSPESLRARAGATHDRLPDGASTRAIAIGHRPRREPQNRAPEVLGSGRFAVAGVGNMT